jgi:hypothetical protein
MVTRKPLDLPPAVAREFMKDMMAYFAEDDGHRRDAIAARQLHALREVQGPREKALRLSDVKRMFILTKNKT